MRQILKSGRPAGSGAKARAFRSSLDRKLRVEPIEGRLMLSATSGALPSVGVNVAADFDANWFLTSVVERYTTNFAQHDGGLITTNGTTSMPRASDNFVPNIDSDIPLVFSGEGFTFNFSDATVTNAWETQPGPTSGGGLQPITIVRNTGGVLEAATPPGAFPMAKTPTVEEGGPIAIPKLLAGMRQELGSPQQPVGSMIARIKESPAAVTAPLPTSANTLSGEWGRAAVFSRMGNEREALTDQSLTRMRNTSFGDADYSATRAETANAGSHAQAKPAPTNDATGNPGKTPSANEASGTGSGQAEQRTSAVESIRATTAGMRRLEQQQAATAMFAQSASIQSVVGTEDKRSVARLAAAYAEIGQDAVPNDSILSADGLWQRRRLAAPLLLVLAIERIAAINARETGRSTTNTRSSQLGRKLNRSGGR